MCWRVRGGQGWLDQPFKDVHCGSFDFEVHHNITIKKRREMRQRRIACIPVHSMLPCSISAREASPHEVSADMCVTAPDRERVANPYEVLGKNGVLGGLLSATRYKRLHIFDGNPCTHYHEDVITIHALPHVFCRSVSHRCSFWGIPNGFVRTQICGITNPWLVELAWSDSSWLCALLPSEL